MPNHPFGDFYKGSIYSNLDILKCPKWLSQRPVKTPKFAYLLFLMAKLKTRKYCKKQKHNQSQLF